VRIAETLDVAAELARLRKEEERLTKDIASKVGQLDDPVFLNRAPEKIVQALRATLAERRIELQKVQARIKELESGN
jgi:valyl-tRNA synthetase